jgi:hypothetical protein
VTDATPTPTPNPRDQKIVTIVVIVVLLAIFGGIGAAIVSNVVGNQQVAETETCTVEEVGEQGTRLGRNRAVWVQTDCGLFTLIGDDRRERQGRLEVGGSYEFSVTGGRSSLQDARNSSGEKPVEG